MKKKEDKEHYVDNEMFLRALVMFKKDQEESDCPVRIPEYIGECFLKIATRLSYSHKFINYPFREDMICDGVENCVTYVSNFDPSVSKNPFAYFTQIIYYAFLRRIEKEKTQLYIKAKQIEQAGVTVETSYSDEEDETTEIVDTYIESIKDTTDIISDFETKMVDKKEKAAKKRRRKRLPLEEFEDGDDEDDDNNEYEDDDQ